MKSIQVQIQFAEVSLTPSVPTARGICVSLMRRCVLLLSLWGPVGWMHQNGHLQPRVHGFRTLLPGRDKRDSLGVDAFQLLLQDVIQIFIQEYFCLICIPFA